MNGWRPAIGTEFDDEYINAKKKLMDFYYAFNKLNPMQKERLTKEVINSEGMTAAFEQFVRIMSGNGGI